MNDVINNLNQWFQQAWVWVISMMAVITAIGIPSLVQIAKIFSSAKLYLTQTKTLLGKLNACIKTINELNETVSLLKNKIIENDQGELEYLKSLKLVTYNKKQQEIINERMTVLENDISTLCDNHGIQNVAELSAEELDSKKRIKVKVKAKE